jgi:hypothetical protein
MPVKVINIVATTGVMPYGTRYISKSLGTWNHIAVKRT